MNNLSLFLENSDDLHRVDSLVINLPNVSDAQREEDIDHVCLVGVSDEMEQITVALKAQG